MTEKKATTKKQAPKKEIKVQLKGVDFTNFFKTVIVEVEKDGVKQNFFLEVANSFDEQNIQSLKEEFLKQYGEE